MPDAPISTPAAPTESTPAPAATPAPAPSPAAFSWDTIQLSPEAKQLVGERKWESVDSAINSYRNLEKLTGVPPDRIIKLPADNDAKAWGEVYTKLGRPETADKYTIPLPEGDKGEFASVAKNWFHEAGVSQSAATKLAERWNGYMAEQQKAVQTKQAEVQQTEINALKQAWGSEYEAKAQLVDRAAETFGMTQAHLAALKQALGPKAAMEFLHNIGAKVAVEANAPIGMSGGGGGVMTAEQAQAELTRLRSDKMFSALFNHADPKQRMEAREKMDRLAKLAYPGMSAS